MKCSGFLALRWVFRLRLAPTAPTRSHFVKCLLERVEAICERYWSKMSKILLIIGLITLKIIPKSLFIGE